MEPREHLEAFSWHIPAPIGFFYIQHLFFLKKWQMDACLSAASQVFPFPFPIVYVLHVLNVCGTVCINACTRACRNPRLRRLESPIIVPYFHWCRVSHPNVELANMASLTCQLTLGIIYLHLPRMELLVDHPALLIWLWVSQDLNPSPQTFMARTWTTKPSTLFL